MKSNKKKSKTANEIKDEFSILEVEDNSADMFEFYEGEPKIDGTLLASFSFDSEGNPNEVNLNSQFLSEDVETDLILNKNSTQLISKENIAISDTANNEDSKNPNNESSIFETKNVILDDKTSKGNPSGRTPPVDGEIYDMVRTYTLRRSTVRILSKIKSIHTDDNVYLNTIVDEAIRYYYEYLKNSIK